jgi:hypothetical protein
VLTDHEISELSPTERRDLIVRLARPLDEVVTDPSYLRRQRLIRLGLSAVAALLLVPWIFYLAFALPNEHAVRNWDVMWVGFDIAELALFAVTFWLMYKRRLLAVLTGVATGVLLLCDAWFDIMTAAPGDLWQSVAAAVVIEIPLAVFLMSGAFRAIRIVPAMLWFAEPGAHTWEVRLPLVWAKAGKSRRFSRPRPPG